MGRVVIEEWRLLHKSMPNRMYRITVHTRLLVVHIHIHITYASKLSKIKMLLFHELCGVFESSQQLSSDFFLGHSLHKPLTNYIHETIVIHTQFSLFHRPYGRSSLQSNILAYVSV